ncbi:MFS transporter [Actinomadura sp. DC4]|uniref:MFS transporter n=1 Tax=Actinomadura sp. DC4 TaxID=3055069 RepID=UPI0025B12E07|nr:MFS transporter [Actinomadura sp. DC4]MDN3354232.1 MFS transporter [Actinomadura sp. DC4]
MSATRPFGRGATLLFAVACGVAVGNVYLPQPLLALMAADLRVSPAHAGLVATLTQFGYAAGILLLVPLGDLVRPRRLVTILMAATTAGLVIAAVAPALGVLAVAATLIGILTVAPQILVPLAGHLAPPGQAGRAVGTLVTGLIAGIFGSRLLGSLLAQATSWRLVYAAAAVLTLLAGVLLRPALPEEPIGRGSYPRALAGLPGLLRRQAALRQACLVQFCSFAVFSGTWTVLALYVTGPRFGWSTGTAGLFGLVGLAAGALTPIAGHRTDRHGPLAVTAAAVLASVVGVVVLTVAGTGPIGLVAGTFAVTVGMQSAQIANQARIFADRPDARSQVNTLYMTAAFLGGSLGSAAGTTLYNHHGWGGVCAANAVFVTVALAGHLLTLYRTARDKRDRKFVRSNVSRG